MEKALSIVVCTRNRREQLFVTIDSLKSQKTNDEFNYEISIIDSSDDDSIRNTLAKQYPNSDITYYWEPDLNLSEARNFGIKSARGKIVAFIDDDGIAQESWLSEHYKLYADFSVVSVGGKIVPKWLNEIPPWLSPEILAQYSSYLSLHDLGWKIKQIRYPETPYGCNMSFRRDIFFEKIEFDKRLGRRKNNLMSGEETFLYYLLNKKRYKIMYTPFAKVYHQIDSSRLTKSFFNRRSYWEGVSNARMDKMIMNEKQVIIKSLKFCVVNMPRNIIGYIIYSWVLRNRFKMFVHKTRIIYFVGYLFEGIKPF